MNLKFLPIPFFSFENLYKCLIFLRQVELIDELILIIPSKRKEIYIYIYTHTHTHTHTYIHTHTTRDLIGSFSKLNHELVILKLTNL